MGYLIPKEAAKKWGISERRVQILCTQGKIIGAERHGRIWLIPETAEKPEDARIKSGRYIKSSPKPLTAASDTTVPRPRLKEKIAPPAAALHTFTPMRAMAKPLS